MHKFYSDGVKIVGNFNNTFKHYIIVVFDKVPIELDKY